MTRQIDTSVQLRAVSLVFLVFSVLGLLIRLFNIGNPLNDWDETVYALIARSLMSGELPYHGVFDHKPIALYYIFALFFRIFGYTLTAMRLMPIAAILLTTCLLYRIARKQFPPHQHFVAFCTILFMATCSSFGNGGLASNTEILQMPVFAGWWLAALNCPQSSWRRPVLLGALAGAATQINYLGGFVLAISTALLLAWPVFAKASGARLRLFLAGGLVALAAFIVVTLLMLAPLIVAADLRQYFAMQRGFLGGYQGVLTNDRLVRAVFSVGIPAGFFVALLACIGRCDRSFRCLARPALDILAQLAVVFAVTLLAIGLTKRLYPHYFNLLIVPSTLILLMLLGSASDRVIRCFTAWAGVLAAVLVLRGAWDVYLKDWHDEFKQQREIAQLTQEIRSHARPGERVLLLNLNHTLYFLADVVPATRFVSSGWIFVDHFLSAIGSSPKREISMALETEPIYVMACFDNISADYRAFIERKLAVAYRGYSFSGHDECFDLVGYDRINNVAP